MSTLTLPANNWRPRPHQLPLWSYLEHGGKRAIAIWHRRSGKDEVGLHYTCVAAHKRIGTYWHMLPEAAQGRKVIWDAINPHTGKRRIDEVFPQAVRAQTRDSEMFIRFHCGSTWQVVGSDNFNSLMGSPPIGIVLSEFALSDPRAWDYIRPILAENGGWAIFATTPRGYNHGHDLYQYALTAPAWHASLVTAEQSGVIPADVLADERASMPDELYRQEYGCDFSASNVGAILGRYVEDAERQGRINDDVDCQIDVEISADLGRRDTAAWWFWEPSANGIAIVDYDQDTGLVAEDWVERLKAKPYTIKRIWLPHDARAKTIGARKSVIEQFLDAFDTTVMRIVPIARIADRINAARLAMPFCHFNRTRCKEGLAGLRSWSYEFNEETKIYSREPKHDWASHPGDAFSYGAMSIQHRATTQKPTPRQASLAAINKAKKRLTFEEAHRRQEERNSRRRPGRI